MRLGVKWSHYSEFWAKSVGLEGEMYYSDFTRGSVGNRSKNRATFVVLRLTIVLLLVSVVPESCTVVHCSTVQYSTLHCSTVQCTAIHCNTV